MTKQIITVGRGHSGTRIVTHVLAASGVFVGKVSGSGDHLPPFPMYKAVRQFGLLVNGDLGEWDFSAAMATPPTQIYRDCISEYLQEFAGQDVYGWKLPESVLALPWLVQLFPDAYFIHWVRDGRDNILSWHGTENEWYKVLDEDYVLPEDRLIKAAYSWDYHEELIAQTPKPERWLKVRFEDFVMRQSHELHRLSEFLDMSLTPIAVNSEPVGRYLRDDVDISHCLPILERHLITHDYIEEYEYAD